MAYEMHEWVCNEPITADKLNHMEQGIVEAQNDESGSDVLIIREDTEASTSSRIVYDKTWQEVYDALKNGTRVVMLHETESPLLVANTNVEVARQNESTDSIPYGIYSSVSTSSWLAKADTADGYLYKKAGGDE